MINELENGLSAVIDRCCAVLWLRQCAALVCCSCVSYRQCCLCNLHAETVVSLRHWGFLLFFCFEICKCWKFRIPLLSFRKARQKTRAKEEDTTYMALQKTHPTSEYDIIRQPWLICWILNSVSKWREHMLTYIILQKCTFEALFKFDMFQMYSLSYGFFHL